MRTAWINTIGPRMVAATSTELAPGGPGVKRRDGALPLTSDIIPLNHWGLAAPQTVA